MTRSDAATGLVDAPRGGVDWWSPAVDGVAIESAAFAGNWPTSCRWQPWVTGLTLLAVDFLSLWLSVTLATLATAWLFAAVAVAGAESMTWSWANLSSAAAVSFDSLGFNLGLPAWITGLLVALLGVCIHAMAMLYPGAGRSPANELRTLTYCNGAIVASMALVAWGPSGVTLPLLTATLLSGLAIFLLVPAARSTLRLATAKAKWWGCPVMVIGSTHKARLVIRELQTDFRLGLRPVVAVTPPPPPGRARRSMRNLPMHHQIDHAARMAREVGLRHVIIALPDDDGRAAEILQREFGSFRCVTLMPDMGGFAGSQVRPRDIGGLLGLEITSARRALHIKRALDLIVTPLLLLAALPLMLLIALAVRLSSPGPILYAGTRVGLHGRRFGLWKFRTMVENSNQVLQEYLETHPELRREWELNQKLQRDPRITPVGRFLRSTSLDELPQLWNVLIGDISLVGPRPLPVAEIPRYRDCYELYKRVRPGITGLWQVSGRNNTPYARRLYYTTYYVRNWSIWLDLHILRSTVRAVLGRDGAY